MARGQATLSVRQQQQPPPVCNPGEHYDPLLGACVPDIITCPPGQHLEGGVCVPDVIQPPPTQTFQLMVRAVDQSGSATPLPPNGLFTTLYDSTGAVITTGFTPVSFPLMAGRRYDIEVADFEQWAFQRWQDGVTTRRRAVTINADTTLTAVYQVGGVTPPPPPSGGLISDVQTKYWHYIPAAGSNNVLVIVGYTAPSSIIGQNIMGVMRILDPLTGAELRADRHQWAGRTFDNVPLNTNLPSSPGSIRVEYFFTDMSGNRISPVSTQTINLGQYSRTYRPLDSPTTDQQVQVRNIYYHYLPLASGDYQVQVVATYSAHSSIIGSGIRGAMDVFLPGSTSPTRTIVYSNSIPAAVDGVLILKAGAGTLSPPNPSALQVQVYVLNDARTRTLSNRAGIDLGRGDLFP